MTAKRSITVFCVPYCGHARAVRELLRRRHLDFTERVLTPDAATEIINAYELYGSPVLVINGDVITGHERIMARIEAMAGAR